MTKQNEGWEYIIWENKQSYDKMIELLKYIFIIILMIFMLSNKKQKNDNEKESRKSIGKSSKGYSS